MTGGPKHDFRTPGAPSGGMACAVMRAEIGFCFRDDVFASHAAHVSNEDHPDKIPRHMIGVAIIEVAIEDAALRRV